jgi:hypothetical protein
MLLVLVVGGGLGWWAYRARVQRAVVAEIRRAGGSVSYDWEWSDNKPVPTGSKPSWPNWLVDAVGPDFLGNVVAVVLANKEGAADDALMVQVGRLRHLEYLSVFKTVVSDAGLYHLRRLTGLRSLHLHQTRVRGPGLVYLEGMTRLEDLMLPHFPITDDDLAHLAGLTRLTRFTLNGDKATNEGMVHLRGMRDLQFLTVRATRITSLDPIRNLAHIKQLDLTDTPIDDAGLAAVANFHELELLSLTSDGQITDAGLVHLSGLPYLAFLALGGTRITDAGLTHLKDLPRLKSLYLNRTGVADAGMARFADSGGLKTCSVLVLAHTKTTVAGAAVLRERFPKLLVVATDLSHLPRAGSPMK